MSNQVYPAGSIHRQHDLYQEVPREDMGIEEQEGNLWIGLMWAIAIQVAGGAVGVLLWRWICR